jgi:ADP-heptose:LPS heptosyltransferase
VILFTPVLYNIREYFPNSEITVFIEKKAYEVIKDNPYIDKYITVKFNGKISPSIYKEIKKKKYDLVLDFYGNPRTALITYFSKAKYRAGFNFRIRKFAYNIVTKIESSKLHNLEFNLKLLEELNIPIKSKEIYIHTDEIHRKTAENWFNSNILNKKNIIGIVISGGWNSKIYPEKDYIELLNLINKKYIVEFVFFWGNEEEMQRSRLIKNGLNENCHIAPELNLKTLAEFYKYCTLLIGNDSGPLHLAVTSKNPVLEISGPINPLLQGPYGEQNEYVYLEGLDCLFCNLLECPIGNKCMKDLPKNKIIEKFEKLLSKNNIKLDLR